MSAIPETDAYKSSDDRSIYGWSQFTERLERKRDEWQRRANEHAKNYLATVKRVESMAKERDGYYDELLTKRGLCKVQERAIDDWKAEAERWRKLCNEQLTILQEHGLAEYGN